MAYDYYADPRFSGMAGATMPQGMNYMNAFRPYQPYQQPYQPMEFQPQPQSQVQQMNQQPQQNVSQPVTQRQNVQPLNYGPVPQNMFIRTVTGREEAVASPIPLDGSVVAFTDFSHNRIYTKQLNMNDGSAKFETYEKVVEKQSVPTTEESKTQMSEEKQELNFDGFIKKDEFDAFKTDIQKNFNEIMSKISEIAASRQEQPADTLPTKTSSRGGNK